MVQTWRLSESHYALFTDNPHVETAARQAGLSPMADYAKDGKLLAVQYAGPEEAVKAVASRKYPEEKFDVPVDVICGALQSMAR
ncbi:MAG: hypothetical protein K6U04_08790 [Armatimonadetes bacterium]|nr:hypothetical protein [Armatimonadota bacterium]